ncbi:abietadienol/abietadienal oxidase [Tripterygium wilfordii]|uniref:abietadienol/abietadienal oxidase n=1 Tax=Tripterygium wilfordii TaxID=458696 RepID=UPI0018F80AE7|nr:abietadienol/abietadienal oxidase [Tripterygium wilfordii]
MEVYSGGLVWVLIIICLFFFTFVLAKYLLRRRKFDHLPPGRRGWPLIGNSLSWYAAIASSHPSQFAQEQAKRYGKIFSCRLFGEWSVVSVDPTFNRFIMQNEGKLFQSSYPKSFRDLVGKNGVITVQGEQQRRFHAIAANMMRVEKPKFHFLEDIQMVMQQTLQKFHDNETILLQDVCRKVSINLMVNQLLGVSSESEINEMAQSFSDFVDGCISIPINFPGLPYHTAMKAREKIISKIYKTIEMLRQLQGASQVGNGVLGRLVNEENLADETVADFIINLLFAGSETTAKTMLFAVYFLTHCPTAMKQLLDEQEGLRRSKSVEDKMLSWQDYKAMSFTQCVIDETLRLAGIAIWLMREAKEDVVYEEYMIPKGCSVVAFTAGVHLDENVYKGALTFNPWRWMDPEKQEMRNWRSSPFYTPFGGGARFCPGAELARLQIALFLHYFVTAYRWTQLKKDRMSFFPSARLVQGFHIRLNRRHQSVKKVQ